jgi:hypothetical protein
MCLERLPINLKANPISELVKLALDQIGALAGIQTLGHNPSTATTLPQPSTTKVSPQPMFERFKPRS